MLALNLAHKGRETRGVLAKATKQTVGSLTWSIVRFFLASSLLFLLPPLAYLLAVTTTAWFSAAPAQGINTYLISSIDPLTLAGATYAYWTPACAYFVYWGTHMLSLPLSTKHSGPPGCFAVIMSPICDWTVCGEHGLVTILQEIPPNL
ncbi:hypothetical protein B0H10DRAFT_2213160 [Mycena sp. CBHHK59/15]|nr:hypothetical protein B0H10DRAFT_2213160 [Mycena sp. CBHHK59/15]